MVLNFKQKSYLEGIWNAIRGVDFKARKWDCYDFDIFIIKMIAENYHLWTDGLERTQEPQKTIYAEIEELGKLCKEYLASDSFEELENIEKRIQELLGKYLFRLWY